jgi:hypothetical protein
MMLPAISWPSWTPATVRMGIMALRRAWRKRTASSLTPLARAVFTYSSRSTSSTAERVVRASTANWKRPRATAGKRSDLTARPTPWPHPSKPPEANQPRRTEKRSTRRRPAQKAGTAIPSWDRIMVR